jgi:hypothetical protein
MRNTLLLTALLAVLFAACGDGGQARVPAEELRDGDFLETRKGQVVVLLMGMQGCQKTSQATEVLAELSGTLGDQVTFARIDVPPPRSSVDPVANWRHDYHYGVDEDRLLADELDFFYYPTLYILDRDGEVRYSGGCEPEALSKMVKGVRDEKPGDMKITFSLPMLGVGAMAPDVVGAQVDPTTPTVYFFTSIDCPFSRKAMEELPLLLAEFEEEEYDVVVVEKGRSASAIGKLYDESDLDGLMVHDKDGAVSRDFGVEPVPFYFVADDAGKVTARGPYTESALRRALGGALGLDLESLGEDESEGAG